MVASNPAYVTGWRREIVLTSTWQTRAGRDRHQDLLRESVVPTTRESAQRRLPRSHGLQLNAKDGIAILGRAVSGLRVDLGLALLELWKQFNLDGVFFASLSLSPGGGAGFVLNLDVTLSIVDCFSIYD